MVTHILPNADRHRTPGSPITISLIVTSEQWAMVEIHNAGSGIPAEQLDRIFEYGYSGTPSDAEAGTQRGQGLFVARTYMAKMGGTVTARSTADGITFTLQLQRTG